MPSWPRVSVALVALGWLVGCATSAHYPMNPEAPEAIESFNAHVGVSQSEIEPTVIQSTGGTQFGLVGALVDAAVTQNRTETAEELVTPIRDALIDYDFPAEAREIIQPELEQLPWETGSNPAISSGSLQGPYEQSLANNSEDAMLFLTYEYRTSADFSTVQVTLKASMFPSTPGLDGYRDAGRPAMDEESPVDLDLAIYRNVFTVDIELDSDASSTEYSELWAEDDGRRAKEALDLAIAHAAKMLRIDIQMVDGQVTGSSNEPSHAINGKHVNIAHEGEDLTIYRQRNDTLYVYDKIAG